MSTFTFTGDTSFEFAVIGQRRESGHGAVIPDSYVNFR